MSIYFFDFADYGALATGDMGLDYATRDAARSDAVSALQSIVRDLVLDRHSRREVSILKNPLISLRPDLVPIRGRLVDSAC